MPTLDISPTVFSRLQSYATPLVDSAETALIKVLDLADMASKGGAKPSVSATATLQSVPDLSFTTLTSATINGKPLPPGQVNWNALMLATIEAAAPHVPKGKEISDLVVVNHVTGQKEDNGYKFLKSVGLSVQGQNANNAWKAISHVAKAAGLKVEARFYWSAHPKAAKPSEQSTIAT